MKKFLFLPLLVFCLSASAQWTIINGKQRFTKGLGLPTIDTLTTGIPNDSSQIVLNPNDSALYFKYKGYWRPVGSGGTSETIDQVLSNGNTATNKTLTIDNPYNGKFIQLKNLYTAFAGKATIEATDGDNNTSGYINTNSVGAINVDSTANMFYNRLVFGNSIDSQIVQVNPNYSGQIVNLPASSGTLALTSDIDTAKVVIAEVYNAESTTLTRGTVVYLYGANGDRASVKRANNKQDATSANTMGFVRADIAAGGIGYVTTQGQVEKLDLGAYTAGQIVYLDSINGQFTTTKPVAPYHLVYLGVIERANNGNGLIWAKAQNGYELDELHDVKITSKANNDVLAYESSTGLWKNKQVTTVLGYTPIAPTDTATMLANYAKTSVVNTKLAIADTTVFDRKSAASYTFRANNTSSTANMSDQVFNDKGQQTYSGTITWTGTTAPSGSTSHTYRWTQIGKMVTLNIELVYATAGTALTQVVITLPTDCPTPNEPTGLGSANEFIYPATAFLNTSSSTAASVNTRAYMRANAADNGHEILVTASSANFRYVYVTLQYWTP